MPRKDYYPLVRGMALYYAYVDYSRSEPEVSRMVWRVEQTGRKDGALLARISTRWGAGAPSFHEARVDARGVFVAEKLELRLPPKAGDSWKVERDPYFLRVVNSVKAPASGINRDFKDCVEVGFTNEDTDSGSRFYAPAIGLVRETWLGETYNSVLALAHWEIPA